jgi:hypothetical protein
MFYDEFDGNQSDAETARLMRQDDSIEMSGDNNSPPIVSDPGKANVASVLQLLGSAPQVARDVGTAVGTVRRQVEGIGPAYTNAQNAAYQGNSLSTWWQYETTANKAMILIGIAGIAVVLMTQGD